MDTELTVDQIISEEIKEYRLIQRNNTETVSSLIKSSAKKLADSGVVEQNQISRILKGRFSDHKRWVEKVLPDEYKLTTKPKQEDEPKTEIQELFYLSKELYKEKAELSGKLYHLLKHEDNFEDTIQYRKEAIVRSIEEIKSEFAEIEVLKKQIDKRELLHSWNKVIVRKMALENTLHHVSSKFDQSAKCKFQFRSFRRSGRTAGPGRGSVWIRLECFTFCGFRHCGRRWRARPTGALANGRRSNGWKRTRRSLTGLTCRAFMASPGWTALSKNGWCSSGSPWLWPS